MSTFSSRSLECHKGSITKNKTAVLIYRRLGRVLWATGRINSLQGLRCGPWNLLLISFLSCHNPLADPSWDAMPVPRHNSEINPDLEILLSWQEQSSFLFIADLWTRTLSLCLWTDSFSSGILKSVLIQRLGRQSQSGLLTLPLGLSYFKSTFSLEAVLLFYFYIL